MVIALLTFLMTCNVFALEVDFEIKDLARLENIAQNSFCTPVEKRVGRYEFYDSNCELSEYQISEIENSIHHTTGLIDANQIYIHTHRYLAEIKKSLAHIIYEDLIGKVRVGKVKLSYKRSFDIQSSYIGIEEDNITRRRFKFKRSIYIYFDFRFKDFTNKIFSKVKMKKSFFYKSNFSNSDIRNIEFIDCDLAGSFFNFNTKLPFSFQEAVDKGMIAL